MSMEALQERIGYRFHDKALLERALIHSSYREATSKKVLGMRYCHHLATAQRGGYVDDTLVRAASEDQVWITLCKDEGSIDQHIDPFEEGTLAGMGEDLLKGETRIAPDGLAAALAQAIGQTCEGLLSYRTPSPSFRYAECPTTRGCDNPDNGWGSRHNRPWCACPVHRPSCRGLPEGRRWCPVA